MDMSHQIHLAGASCSASCVTADTCSLAARVKVTVPQSYIGGGTADPKDALICTCEIISAHTSLYSGFVSRLKCS